MRRDWVAWALSGFWNWAPALIALEPGAMAYAEAFREKGAPTSTEADVAPSIWVEPAVLRPTWAKGFEK